MACSRSCACDSPSSPSSGVSNIEVASRFEKSNQLYKKGPVVPFYEGGTVPRTVPWKILKTLSPGMQF